MKNIAKKINTKTWIGLGLIAVLAPIFLFSLLRPQSSEANWFDDAYGYRVKYTFTHNAALSDRRVSVTIDTASLTTDKMQADCDDTRFTDLNGKVLRYQLVSGCDTASTTYDILIPAVINGSNVFYVYYGNPSASTASEDISGFTSLSPSGGNPSASSEEKGQGPVLYLGLDEGYGAVANDGTANNNDGSISGATWKQEEMCVSSKCLSFDGTNDVVTVSNSVAGIQTVSLWVKVFSTSTTEQLIDLNGTDYITSTNGVVTANSFGTETVYVDGLPGTALTANRWHHISVTTTGGLTGSAIKIGQISTNYGQIVVDEVKLYNYERTGSQIKSDFSARTDNDGASSVLGVSDQVTLSDGLIGYWKMDETSGNASDSSGNGVTLTNNGTTTYVSGKFGNGSEHVPASSQYLSSGSTINGVKSISFWVNPDSTTNYYISLTSSAYITSSSGTLSATGFTNPKIFVNGVETSTIAADTWQLVIVVTDTAINADTFYIGRQGSNYFDGTMDEVRLYNTPLTQIEKIYNWAPNPVAYWNLDENTGTAANDSSGNGYVGTLTSGPTWDRGKLGASVKFDGSDDFIDIGAGPAAVNTVSFWAKPTTTTEYFIDLNGTAYISSSGGTLSATGFSSPTIYVNGVVSSTITAGTWQHIAVTTATAINASDLDIGRIEGVGNMEGFIDEVKLYNYTLSAAKVIESFSGRPNNNPYIEYLRGYWKMDEASPNSCAGGTNDACDSSPYGYDGAWNGTATSTLDAKYGMGLFLDGSGDFVSFPSTTGYADITVEAWVYRLDSDLEHILSHGSTTGVTRNFNLFINSSNFLALDRCSGASCSSMTSTTAIPSNTWTHIAFTDNAKNVTFYINGIPAGTASYSLTVTTASLPFGIGHISGDTTASRRFTGRVDEVRWYSAALSREQIIRDMNAGVQVNFGFGENEREDVQGGAGNQPNFYLPFDENTGSTVYDKGLGWGASTFTGGTWSRGKFGSAINLDGNGDWVSMIDGAQNTSASHTYSLWFKANTLTANDGLAGDWTANDTGTLLFVQSTGVICAYINASENVCTSETISLSTWHHVALVYNTANTTLSLYLDGKFIGSDTAGTADGGTFYIGGYGGTASTSFDGLIDEYRQFDYALSAAQIAYDYNRGAPFAHYQFDECQATTAYDKGEGAHNGTITPGGSGNTSAGACGSGTGTEMWNDGTTGKFNASLGFDGTDDYVTVADTTNLRFDDALKDFSVFAWVKRSANGEAYIISKEDADNDGWRLLFTSSNTVQCSVDAIDVTGSAAITDTNWHFVGCTIDRDGNGQVYVDGKVDGSTQAISSEAMANTSALTIGTRSYSSTSYLTGQIDEVQIYSYAMSVAQIRKAMNDNSAVRFGPSEGQP